MIFKVHLLESRAQCSVARASYLKRTSKKGDKFPLQLALMRTYKTDLACALEHIAAAEGLPTTYNDMSTLAREKRANKANLARQKRRPEDDSGVIVPQIRVATS